MTAPGWLANKAVWLFALAWATAFGVLVMQGADPTEPVAILAIFGCGLPLLALLTCIRAPQPTPPGAPRAGEWGLLIGLLVYVAAVLAVKGPLLDALLPEHPDARLRGTVNALLKMAAFAAVPVLIYRARYRAWPEAGSSTLSRGRLALVFAVMALCLFGVSILISNGARELFSGRYGAAQIGVGLALSFVWMSLEAGLVEEVFFRWLLQSRIAALTGSQLGGVLIGALLFGVAHAPGMWLRGAGVSEGLGASPELTTTIAYSICVQGVAGLLFGVLWARTRSLWLVIALHGLGDAFSNAAEFIDTWGL